MTRVRAALLALACACAAPAFAGALNWPCDRPFVFPGAAVNVVILPYSVAPGIGADPRSGTDLAGLIQQEVLLSIAKFGSVGAVQLKGNPDGQCVPDVVARKLLGEQPGAETTVRSGAGLVLLWGRVFETGGNLYLQSYARFLRRGTDESVRITLGGETFTARPSAQAFACTPRRIALADLARIGEIARARVIRPKPDESVNGYAMPSEPYPYWVSDMQGDWLKIQSRDGPSGWMLAKAEAPGWTLRERMPELSFIEGVTGYLRYQVSSEQKAPATTLDAAARAFDWFQKNWRAGAVVDKATGLATQPMAVAIPLQLQGMLTLLRPGADAAAADEPLQKAATLLPYSADARNLQVVASLARSTDPRPVLEALEAALGSEPTNPVVLDNLVRLHRLMLAPAGKRPAAWPAISDEQRTALVAQLEALAAVKQ